MSRWIAIVVLCVLAPFALAQDQALSDPAAEARAQAMMRELRCVACENEPISQSSAPIAEDMRRQVRDMVAAGASDAEIRDWFEARYGAFVRFRPKADTPGGWFLWGAPFLILAAGAGFLVLSRRRQPSGQIEPVRPDEP